MSQIYPRLRRGRVHARFGILISTGESRPTDHFRSRRRYLYGTVAVLQLMGRLRELVAHPRDFAVRKAVVFSVLAFQISLFVGRILEKLCHDRIVKT